MAERYEKIAFVNLKYNLLPHLAAALLLCVAAPLFMGTKNLDYSQSAKVIECYLTLLGIILLAPVFQPDLNREAADVIRTKKSPMTVSYLIRIVESLFFLLLLGTGFLWYMKGGNCAFPMMTGMFAFCANVCFTGSLALIVFSFSGNPVFAYMVPIVYYIANMGAGRKFLGKFYLFSMQAGNTEDKLCLLAAAVVFTALAVWHKRN